MDPLLLNVMPVTEEKDKTQKGQIKARLIANQVAK